MAGDDHRDRASDAGCDGWITIGFTFFFGTENLSAQAMMTGILSILVLMGLLVIISIDHPFTGPVRVESTPLENALADFNRGS